MLSIFSTKTFWINAISAASILLAGSYGVVIPHAAEILAGLNILNRLLLASSGTVTLFGSK